jgi:hypothetical protein
MHWLRKSLLLFLPLVPAALPAQSVISLDNQKCVWRSGDDPAWAASSLDESSWRPCAEWKPQHGLTRIWVRYHPDLTLLKSEAQLALQVSLFGNYQAYLNGHLIGGTGNLETGFWSANSTRSFPIDPGLLGSQPSTLALRITNRTMTFLGGTTVGLTTGPMQIRFGDRSLLDGVRAALVVSRTSPYMLPVLCFGVIGVIAIMLLGLYIYDRTRVEILLLSISCLALALIRFNEFCAAAMVNYPLLVCYLIVCACNIGLTVTEVPFFYALAKRRVPLVFQLTLGAVTLIYLFLGAQVAFASSAALEPLDYLILHPISLVFHLLFSIAPFLIFWRNLRVADRIRPIALLCMAWGAADFIWFVVELTGIPIPGVPNLFARWGLTVLGARGFAVAGLLTALLALMFREQRQVTEERAILAGEMQAAGDIQRMLAPSTLKTAPGLQIEVAFCPMREVGGDFYQCRVLPDRRQRLLVGDVSGKGTGAAMAAALILGGAAARDTDSPAELLAHLNRVLRESQVGGFATCLCADVAPDGSVQFANAGHLSPYCRNQEIAMQSGLPLGLTLDERYEQMEFQLAPGATLTFLSDGVVEARNSAGSLFGFERTLVLSSQPASAIADAAQKFGQEDDITVLTLSRLPTISEPKIASGSAAFAQA